MSEPQITVVGNVAQDVRHVTTEQGVPITTFRVASTRRQYDRAAGRWVDGETTFVNVVCWRGLAENTNSSLSKGDPVVVIGRLRIRSWEREGYKGNSVEVEATTVGHDLCRGTSAFRRSQPRPNFPAAEREVADDLLMSMEAGSAVLPVGALAGPSAGSPPGSLAGPGEGGVAGRSEAEGEGRPVADPVPAGASDSPSGMSGQRRGAAA